jgi:AraC-like DNA-binding protein
MKNVRISLIVQLLVMYLVIALIVLIAMYPIYLNVLNLTKNNYVKKSLQDLSLNADIFDNIIDNIWLVKSALEENQSYNDLKLFHGKERPTQYYYILRRGFYSANSGLKLIEHAYETFVYFSNSDTILTKNYAFDNSHDCFSKYIVYEEYDAQDIITEFSKPNTIQQLLPTRTVTFFKEKSGNYITLIVKEAFNTAIFGALISETEILKLFHFYGFPKDSFIYISAQDKIPFSYNYFPKEVFTITGRIEEISYNNNKYTVISKKLKSIDCTIVLGIPDYYFADMLQPLKKLYIQYALIALILGLFLGILFSLYHYAPVNKMVNLPLIRNYSYKRSGMSIYSSITEAIEVIDVTNKNLTAKIAATEEALCENLFVRLLLGNIHIIEDQKLAYEILPQVNDPYHIVIVKYLFDDYNVKDDICSVWLYDYLSKQLSKQLSNSIIIGRIYKKQIAVLIPASNFNNEIFCNIVNRIDLNSDRVYQTNLQIGVSDINTGIHGIHKAFCNAQQCLLNENTTLIHYFEKNTDHQVKKVVELNDLQKLFGLIITGETKAIQLMIKDIITVLTTEVIPSQLRVQQTFYAVRLMFEEILIDFDLTDITIPEYDAEKSVKALFETLNDCAIQLAQEITSKRSDANLLVKLNIIKHIEKNFHTPDIYAETIAANFNCSKAYIYKIVREQTGKSLNEYIEYLRMKHSLELIKNTDISISDISAKCGYNSVNNFYKAFKKNYGIPPGSYRRNV